MDFFESQDVARKKTGLLIFYFALSVVAMIVALYLVWCLLGPAIPLATSDSSASRPAQESPARGDRPRPKPRDEPQYEIDWWQPQALLITAAVVLAIVGLGSLYKIMELRGGGAKIAELLGGRRIHPNTSDPGERRLLNVVEEMAIASGTPVPPVYVLDREEGINAFAAGYSPSDAVIGVNRGTIEFLSRDELQGVMAHEFSHIINGDMRMNIRLMGVLNGILVLAIIGLYCFRFGWLSGATRSRSRESKGNAAMVVMALGFAAMIIGGIGLICARLIKAAVSRQREYLADASAVQFTRNPDGIAGALKKIGGLAGGSRVHAPEAESASHMFFGNAVKSAIGGLSTHPPLSDRIKRIDPNFDGRFPNTQPYREEDSPVDAEAVPRRPAGMRTPMGNFGIVDAIPLDPVLVLGAMGEANTRHVQYSQDLIASLPPQLHHAIHDLFSARAVVFGMLLDHESGARQQQLAILRQNEGQPTADETARLSPVVKQQGEIARLPIIEMVQSTLSEMSIDQYDRFRDSVVKLVKADGKVELFEFMLQRVLLEHLDRLFRGKKPPTVKYHALAGVIHESAGLISCLARVGHDSESETARAFDLAIAQFNVKGAPPQLLSQRECSLSVVNAALDKLKHASPAVKKQLLSAALACIGADGRVTVAEAELLRTIADSLDCPIPPIAVGPVDPPVPT